MKTRSKCLMQKGTLLSGLLILTAGVARAASSWTELTPTTLRNSPLTLTVHAKQAAGKEQFEVTARRPAGDIYHFLHAEGWLETGPFQASAFGGRPSPAPVTITQPTKETTIFRFTLPDHGLTNIRLCFGFAGYDTGRMVMPSGDFYWLLPSVFVTQQNAAGRAKNQS